MGGWRPTSKLPKLRFRHALTRKMLRGRLRLNAECNECTTPTACFDGPDLALIYSASTVNLLYRVSLSRVSRLLRCDFAGNPRFVNVLRCIALLGDTLVFSHILLTHPIQYTGENSSKYQHFFATTRCQFNCDPINVKSVRPTLTNKRNDYETSISNALRPKQSLHRSCCDIKSACI